MLVNLIDYMRKIMRVDLFDFELPEEFIAKKPLDNRADAKLLVVPDMKNFQVKDLVDLLEAGTLVVCNNTKVIPARIFGVCHSKGERVYEVMLHKNVGLRNWLAYIRNSKKLNVGDVLSFENPNIILDKVESDRQIALEETLFAKVVEKHGEAGTELEFNFDGEKFFEMLELVGKIPLPPYIKREVEKSDLSNYQTVYAKYEGAVAAPTAGLHFTDELIEKMKAKGMEFVEVTLHVGAGTFQPIKVDDTDNHIMHSEYGIITKDVADKINKAKGDGRKIMSVGTTSLRLLESAVGDDGMIATFEGETDIFITPPYEFKSVDYLMTNFHLPKSTLFMLVCAFAGMDVMKKAYEFAKENGYRFYSYGDTSLLKKEVK